MIEPAFKKIKFLKFADYKDYISACKKDEKIDLLSEKNNSFRSISSMLALLLILKVYEWIADFYPVLNEYGIVILVFVLFIVFLFAYRKQTEYVVKRVDNANR